MSRGKKMDNRSLRAQGFDRLKDMYDAGRGKAKVRDKSVQSQRINSTKTFDDYCQNWDYFIKYLKERGIKCKTLDEAAKYVQDYIDYLTQQPGKQSGSTMSASTIRTYFAPVAKICGLSCKDYKLPTRSYRDCTRSRLPVNADKHFSISNNRDLINFCKATGLRRNCELRQLSGKDLIDHGDGAYSVIVRQGKGGKYREAPIVGSPAEVKAVVDRIKAAGDKPVWRSVPKACDVHSYRADYAKRIYEANARPVDTLPRSEQYITRKDHIIYDKRALIAASIALGHCSWRRDVAHYAEPRYDKHGRLTDYSYNALKAAAARGDYHLRANVVVQNYLWNR